MIFVDKNLVLLNIILLMMIYFNFYFLFYYIYIYFNKKKCITAYS